MKRIFSFLILVLISSTVFSHHKPWENRVQHDYDTYTRDNTYATAIDQYPLNTAPILVSRARTSAKNKNDENYHRWIATSNVRCHNEEYKGHWGFSNHTPHEVKNVRGSAAGKFEGIYYQNSRVEGKVAGTADCRNSIGDCCATGSITAWKKNESGSSLIWADAVIPW
ncbi:MAG: hypothetical protein OXU23_11415 [Candidatus Poribacteria bacterium]|nr:hypothetical protein [Candidatus Poribacteria bacterium]